MDVSLLILTSCFSLRFPDPVSLLRLYLMLTPSLVPQSAVFLLLCRSYMRFGMLFARKPRCALVILPPDTTHTSSILTPNSLFSHSLPRSCLPYLYSPCSIVCCVTNLCPSQVLVFMLNDRENTITYTLLGLRDRRQTRRNHGCLERRHSPIVAPIAWTACLQGGARIYNLVNMTNPTIDMKGRIEM